MSAFFGSVWWLIVTLGLLITFHEYGHFVIARRCGVKVLKFSVGFGPALWSRLDRHGTQFVVAAIPLGGYVKMLDTREVDGVVGPTALAGAFDRKSAGQRMAIAAAGPAFNLIFTLAAFWLMFVIGKPDYQPIIGHVGGLAAEAGLKAGERITAIDGNPVENWTGAGDRLVAAGMARQDVKISLSGTDHAAHELNLALSKLPIDLDQQAIYERIGLTPQQLALPPVIGEAVADGAAAKAGLKAGDRVISIGGQAIGDWREVSKAIQSHAPQGEALAIVVDRAGQRLAVSARPTANPEAGTGGAPRWLLGISPKPIDPQYDATLRYGPLAAVPRALSTTWSQTHQTLVMLGQMVTGQASLKNLSGIITIAEAANASARLGPAWFLNFLAVISLSLAILNLLPIPILDGGALLYYLIELAKGSPVSERVQIAGQYVGLVLLVALMGLALYNDILRHVS
ncbi:MAG: RIP metalloprotease RseP [Dokdonella sp.]|uniref:RIP metalloprotease RseP n=1 Tax=Dokdonella sp. TaxID=2291710 RepID=UPI0025B88598|nr:RIP metalloprotease RseP [Dokdonella sp.]MBZ0222965.1 RIP metalloprotease RseP [Dokdonella sp.]MCC7256243.1 RIP metalloprotease RseP [Dokdonella sp.]